MQAKPTDYVSKMMLRCNKEAIFAYLIILFKQSMKDQYKPSVVLIIYSLFSLLQKDRKLEA
jgi:hypothetical protein